jgi:phage gp36-like protein
MADAAYCTRPELSIWGAPAAAFASIEPDTQDEAIKAASDVINGYLEQRLNLPLISYGREIRRACAIIAAYDLISASRGRNPEEAGDRDPLYDRYKSIMDWLKQVAEGLPTTAVGSPVPDPTVEIVGGASVSSNRQRGWQSDVGCFGGAFTGRRR